MAPIRRKEVTLFKFGLGREVVAIFPPSYSSGEPACAKTLVLDRIPSNSTWAPTYEISLKILDRIPQYDQKRLLEASKQIRELVREKVNSGIPELVRKEDVSDSYEEIDPNTADRKWQADVRIVLACWRGLEIALLEKNISPRIVMVSFNTRCSQHYPLQTNGMPLDDIC